MTIKKQTKINPKSLYVHIPFCEHICDYCDFCKIKYYRSLAKEYIFYLKKEIDSYNIKKIETIYIGGGTPTCLDDDLFLDLFCYLKRLSKGVKEFSVEANPESLSENKLKIMKECGVNRLSIGVESTNDSILSSINRHHTFLDVKNAVSLARKFGFSNINIDLILGLPNVTFSLLERDIDNILSLNVEHVSCYSLTVHPHTVFYLKKVEEIDDEIMRKMYDFVNEKLEKNGFIHYEISNWCKKCKQSLHNLTYWSNSTYYGVGLGASGYIDDHRYTNTRNISVYGKEKYIEEDECVSINDLRTYEIMTNLRTNIGLDLKKFNKLFLENLLESKKIELENLKNSKLIQIINDHIVCTYEGMMLLDKVILSLI